MPRNGRPSLAHAPRRARRPCRARASRPRRQSANAPTPGSTTRSARRDVIGIAGHYDRLIEARFTRRALERLGGRVQIAGAVVDDRDRHRDAPGCGKQADDLRTEACGRQTGAGAGNALRRLRSEPRSRRTAARPLRDRRPRRCRACCQPRLPSVKRRSVAASMPTSSASSVMTLHRTVVETPRVRKPDMQRDSDDDVTEQHQPHPVPQHPQRRQQEGPEGEAVAHEHEALRIGRGVVRLAAAAHARCRSPWLSRPQAAVPCIVVVSDCHAREKQTEST